MRIAQDVAHESRRRKCTRSPRSAISCGPCRPLRPLTRTRALPLLVGALALLPACVPTGLVDTQLRSTPVIGVRSALAAAQQAVLLEPGPPPQPLPASPAPAAPEDYDAPAPKAATNTTLELPDLEPDIWERMRRQFSIPRPPLSRIQHQADWFQEHKDYFDRVAERSRDYLPYIVREAERRGLPVELALLPVIESAFQPFAYSPARASGLWQFIPSTGRLYGLRINWWYDGRRDLVASTSAALEYLEKLHRDFDGDWLLAAAAYNWGEGNLRRAIARNRKRGKPLDFWSLEVPSETRTYVPRWLAVCDIVARPEQYGMTLRRVPDEVTFRLVEVGKQIDLARAAELAEISLDRLYRLNAGYRRWATEPTGPHQLLIPAANSEAFARRVALLPQEQWPAWRHHVVEAGDTLGDIAVRYGTSVASLSRHNRLNGSLIRVGDRLLVPKEAAGPESLPPNSDARREPALASEGQVRHPARRHRVEKGESLWLIARRYDVPIADLVAWNRLDPEVWLMPGQTLELRGTPIQFATVAPLDDESGRYIVRNGDSLWLIARRHGVSVADLRTWNALSPDEWLMPGQALELREGSGRDASALVTAPRGQDGRKLHVVRDGDNLWIIARRRGVSVEDIRAWNGLAPDEWLMPGQILELRGPAERSVSAAPSDGSYRKYVVRNGDSLWLIARRSGVSVAEMRAWNGLEPDDWLMPGQILLLRGASGAPASSAHSRDTAGAGQRYVVRDGDSLWLIARRHSVSTEQLASWNELSINGVLQPGQTLEVAPPGRGAVKATSSTNSL